MPERSPRAIDRRVPRTATLHAESEREDNTHREIARNPYSRG